MAINAHAIYDSEEDMFVRVASILPGMTGSVDQAVSAAWMLRATTLVGALWIVADAVRDPTWLLRLWTTIGSVGGSIALLGLMQKATAAPMIFWRAVEQPVLTFFGTFYYHGNAGAFLNLTLPVTIGLALRAFGGRGRALVRALWLTLSIVSVVAVFSNTSRMAQLLAAGIILALLIGLIPMGFKAVRRLEWKGALVGCLAVMIALVAVVQTSRLDRSLKRWEQITETVPLDGRWLASAAALRPVPEAGWFGFGPGTFHVMFPYYTAGVDKRLGGFWLFLHQDYLQTILEWGWIGSALWGGLFFGGIGVGIWNRYHGARAEQWLPRQRLLLPLVLLGIGSVAVHALVDFPLQIASIQLYAATYLGICWGSTSWKVERLK